MDIFVTGIDEIIVYMIGIDDDEKIIYPEKIPHRCIYVQNKSKLHDGLLNQYLRLLSYKNVKTNYTVFFDNDTLITDLVNIKDFIIDGRPVMGYTNYKETDNKQSVTNETNCLCDPAIQKMIRMEPFMNILSISPHIFKTSTIANANSLFIELNKTGYMDYLVEQSKELKLEYTEPIEKCFDSKICKIISDYGYLGYYIWINERYEYFITNTYTDPMMLRMNKLFPVNASRDEAHPVEEKILSPTDLFKIQEKLLTPYNIFTEKQTEIKTISIAGKPILPDIKYDGLYSFGISKSVDFELEFSQKFGVESLIYDHTISKLPKTLSNGIWHKKGLSGTTQKQPATQEVDNKLPAIQVVDTLINYIASSCEGGKRNMILKINVGGNEIESLLQTPDAVLTQFKTFLIHFHNLHLIKDLSKRVELLIKLNKCFCPIHNQLVPPHKTVEVGDQKINEVSEIVYIRRDPSLHFQCKIISAEQDERSCALHLDEKHVSEVKTAAKLIPFGNSPQATKSIVVKTENDVLPYYFVISDPIYPDRFDLTVKRICSKVFLVSLHRLDQESGWGQQLYLQEKTN
jgi:hypothetical protein